MDCPARAARPQRIRVTSTDEPDIASAAISGVASPTMAIGTATKL